jgi:hypothetical protein
MIFVVPVTIHYCFYLIPGYGERTIGGNVKVAPLLEKNIKFFSRKYSRIKRAVRLVLANWCWCNSQETAKVSAKGTYALA